MYKFDDGQLSIDEFGQPLGMHLSVSNRWVKKARLIPWGQVEKRYAQLFCNRNGNVAKPLRLALGACLIQGEYGYSDVEVALQIQEAPYLQYFCGYKAYDDTKLPFDPSLMVHFRKRLTPEILGEINEMILNDVTQKSKKKDDDIDSNSNNKNSGTLIVDATCAPSQIKYPRDTDLLNDARKATEKLIDSLHKKGTKKPRTYRQKAHKIHKSFARKRKPSRSEIRKVISSQLSFLFRNLNYLYEMIKSGVQLSSKQITIFDTLKKIYEQQKYMYKNKCHSVADRIVSLSQPWIRPIVRGKAGRAVEFGAKLDISVCDGWSRLEVISFDAYNESGTIQQTIENYKQRTGYYPTIVLADKIYRNRENINFCKQRNIRLAGPALGRPKKDEPVDRVQNYQDECNRIEVERKFSLAKRKCGLKLIVTKLIATAYHSIALSIVILNLRKLGRELCHQFFQNFCLQLNSWLNTKFRLLQ